MSRGVTKVLIAGGGVAALEAAMALRQLAPELVDVVLLSPDEHFSYRPLAVTLPFEDGEVVRLELAEIADEIGVSLVRGALTGIEAWRRLAFTSTNHELGYDVLLIACGALPMPAVPGALTFRGPSDAPLVRSVLDAIERREVDSVAFVVPWGPTWPLPAYDLALLAASHSRPGVEVSLVTPEAGPLQIFGDEASAGVRQLLEAEGVRLRTSAYADRFADGLLELVPDEPLSVERAIALPRLTGAPIDGVPQTVDGFIPVDDHGRVHGVDGVYAAGDITSFPVKHGGLAAQEALAAAQAIAASVGADVQAQPFRPVVQGLLLTGAAPRFLRRELSSAPGHEPEVTTEALWWPPAKIVGRYLGPFLAEHAGGGALGEPPSHAVPVDIRLDSEAAAATDVRRVIASEEFPEDEEAWAGEVTSLDVCLVAPEDTLGEIAERLLQTEISAALVAEYGHVIGIVTVHDLMAAFAARAHPSEARARQWMTAEPVTLGADASRAAAARVMRAYGIHHLPLMEGERPVAVLHLGEGAGAVAAVGLGF